MTKVNTAQIGDGKLPNKYRVSIHNDYYYLDNGVYNWVSDREKQTAKAKTIKNFNTYREAKEYFDTLTIGDCFDGIKIMGKNIEDRLTGQLCEEVFVEPHTCSKCGHKTGGDTLYNEDLEFTIKEFDKRGIIFE